MKNVFIITLSILLLTACDKESNLTNDPIEPPTIPTDTMGVYIDEAVYAENPTVFCEDYFGYKMVFITPASGFDNWHDVVDAKQPYIFAYIDNALLGSEIDLTAINEEETEQIQFAIQISIPEISQEAIDLEQNNMANELNSGTLTYQINADKNATIKLDLNLANGKHIVAHVKGIFKEADKHNTITVGDNVEVIQSAFVEESETDIRLYFTPQGIDKGEEIEDVLTYNMLIISPDLLGKTINVATEQDEFSYIYSTSFGESMVYTMTAARNDATGTMSISRKEGVERGFVVTVDIVANDGVSYKLSFDGICKPYTEEPENGFTVKGNEHFSIQSVVVDQTQDVWKVWMSSASGLTTVEDIKSSTNNIGFTMPATLFDGDAHGFSTDTTLSIIYKGQTYGLGNSQDRGTLTAEIENNTILLSFKEWNTPIEGYYHGAITIVK